MKVIGKATKMTVLTQLKCRWHQLVSDCHSSIMFRLNNLFKRSLWIYKDFTPNSENQLRNLEINENPLEFINQKRDIHPKKNYVKHSYRLILHDRFQFSWMWNEKSCKKIMDLKVVATVVVIHWILTDVKPNASWKSIKRFTFFYWSWKLVLIIYIIFTGEEKCIKIDELLLVYALIDLPLFIAERRVLLFSSTFSFLLSSSSSSSPSSSNVRRGINIWVTDDHAADPAHP